VGERGEGVKIPKIVYVALLAGGSALFPALSDLLALGDWAGPVLLALVGLLVRFWDSRDPVVHTMGRDVERSSRLRRFFTE